MGGRGGGAEGQVTNRKTAAQTRGGKPVRFSSEVLHAVLLARHALMLTHPHSPSFNLSIFKAAAQ